MKKISTIRKEKKFLEIKQIIHNTAHVKSATGKSGLVNIKTNQMIVGMDNYFVLFDYDDQFYFLRKEKEKTSEENHWVSPYVITIYDALNEKILADGWKIVKEYGKENEFIIVQDPNDRFHLFDEKTFRNSPDLFDMPFDYVEYLDQYMNEIYFVVTIQDKKGIYLKDRSKGKLLTSIDYDAIKKYPNIIVYTKNNKSCFAYLDYVDKPSIYYDSVTVDPHHKEFLYCKLGRIIDIYDTKRKVRLTSTDYPKIKYMYLIWDHHQEEFFFDIERNGKHGIMSTVINKETKKTQTQTLLLPDYEELVSGNSKTEIQEQDSLVYLKKNGKKGLFLGNSFRNQIMPPKYDDIVFLENDYFLFYEGEDCEIGKISSQTFYESIISHCQIEKILTKGVIYQKDGFYGLFVPSKGAVISHEYDQITCMDYGYFLLEKNGKKGLCYAGEIIVPVIYEDIVLYGAYHYIEDCKTVYFALKKGEMQYELAKGSKVTSEEFLIEFFKDHIFDEIDFLNDIMVLKNAMNVYVYDYDEKLVKVLPAHTVITQIENAKSIYDYYNVNGICYYYKWGRFEELFVEENNFYVTTYETDTNSFEVKTLNKQEHDDFCSYIDGQTNEFAEQRLVELSDDIQTLKKMYPTLNLKKVTKQKENF